MDGIQVVFSGKPGGEDVWQKDTKGEYSRSMGYIYVVESVLKNH